MYALLFLNSKISDLLSSSALSTPASLTDGNGGSSSLGGDLGRLFSLVITFIIILVVTYYTTRFLGKRRFGINKSTNISIIESHGMGYQNMMYLVKVGAKFYLVGVSKENISLMTEVPEETVVIPKDIVKPTQSFETLLGNLIARKKGDNSNDKS